MAHAIAREGTAAPSGLADRVAAIGALDVRSLPGSGSAVEGRLPIGDRTVT